MTSSIIRQSLLKITPLNPKHFAKGLWLSLSVWQANGVSLQQPDQPSLVGATVCVLSLMCQWESLGRVKGCWCGALALWQRGRRRWWRCHCGAVWWAAHSSAALHKHGHLPHGHRTHTSSLSSLAGWDTEPVVLLLSCIHMCAVCMHYWVIHTSTCSMCAYSQTYTLTQIVQNATHVLSSD